MARGLVSLLTMSASEEAPTAFAFSRSWTACGDRSNTTLVWPLFNKRLTMLEPILPRPTIPNCILAPLCFFVFSGGCARFISACDNGGQGCWWKDHAAARHRPELRSQARF